MLKQKLNQLRGLVETGQAPPGKQRHDWDGLHCDLSKGLRGKLGCLSSAVSSPTWLKTAQQTQKAEDAKSCRDKNSYVLFKELLKLDKTQLWNNHVFSELRKCTLTGVFGWLYTGCICHGYSQLHRFPVHLQVWKRRISPCSSQSSQHWRRNPISLIITCEPELESRHRQVLIYSEPRPTGCFTLPSDVTNKAQSQQIEAIHYSWLFPPKPLPFLMTWRAGAEPQARMGASEDSWNPALRKVNSSHFLHKKFTTCSHTILLLAFITPGGLIYSFLAALKQGCILQGNCSTAGAVGSCSIISRTLKAESRLNTHLEL